MGPRQLTDAMLLDLAIRNDGVLATLDRRIHTCFRRVFEPEISGNDPG
jgi:hypothetical protein